MMISSYFFRMINQTIGNDNEEMEDESQNDREDDNAEE